MLFGNSTLSLSLSSSGLLLKILAYSFNFALGNILFYRALEIGPVSIISPLSSSYPVIAVMVAVFIFGEKLLGLQYIAVFFVLIGAFLASFHFERLPVHIAKKSGIIYTLIAAALWGTAIPLSGQVIAEIGWFPTLFYQLLFGVIWLYIFYGLKSGIRTMWGSGLTWTIAAVGVTYLFAATSFDLGLEKSFVSVVTPVSSIYPVVTVALALTVLKEKVLRSQLIGAGLIILGIVILSLG